MGRAAGRRHSRLPLTEMLRGRVQPSTHAKANAAADALGISLSAYLDSLIARDEVDDQGRPTWWPDERTDDHPELFRMTG